MLEEVPAPQTDKSAAHVAPFGGANPIEEALRQHPLPPSLSHFGLSPFNNRPELLQVDCLPGLSQIKRVAAKDLDDKYPSQERPVALVSLVTLKAGPLAGGFDPSVAEAKNVLDLIKTYNSRADVSAPSQQIVSCDFKITPALQQSQASLKDVLTELGKQPHLPQLLVFLEPDASLENDLVGLCKTLHEVNQQAGGCIFGLKTRGALPGSDQNARLAEISSLSNLYSLPMKVRDLSWQTAHDTHQVADFVNLLAATRIAVNLKVAPEAFIAALDASEVERHDPNHPSKRSTNVGGNQATIARDPVKEPKIEALLNAKAPLGAVWTEEGVPFGVPSTEATKMELCLFDSPDAPCEFVRIPMVKDADGDWRVFVKGLEPGQLYGFRATGPHHNPNHLLLDPRAMGVARELRHMDHGQFYKPGVNTGSFAPLSAVIDPRFDWQGDKAPDFPIEDAVIVETHTRGASMRHEGVPEKDRGKFAGLVSDAMLAELKGIGNTVELLPPAACQSEGRYNFWGYNTAAFMAVDPEYCKSKDPNEQVREFKEMVRKLHAAGFKVVADVVFNHTSEGSMGPTICLRGFDRDFYLVAPNGHYIDYTGCGNTVNMDKPQALELVMDSLRYWKKEMHIDYFRFDEAPVLGVNRHNYSKDGAFFRAVQADPDLKDCVMIAEPWSCGPPGQSYQLGQFPKQWSEWNGKFRDDIRSFWRGTGSGVSEFATRLYGSSDVFQWSGRGPAASINFLTAHDGFTLRDLWSYCHKHNLANGENNRDGIDNNVSWNCGEEGPSDNPEVNRIRSRLNKASMATVMLSTGVPMICLGDTILHTQKGNNNAYCQDNEISWLDWAGADRDFQQFVRDLYSLRMEEPVLRRKSYVGKTSPDGSKDVTWINPNGNEMQDKDWKDANAKAIAVTLSNRNLSAEEKAKGADSLFVMTNAHHQGVSFKFPGSPGEGKGHWQLVMDTSREKPFADRSDHPIGSDYVLQDRSMAVFRFVPEKIPAPPKEPESAPASK